MDPIAASGRVLFSFAVICLGVQQFIYTGFLAGLELVPEGMPAHTFWAYLVGALLVFTGLSIGLGKKVRPSALVLGIMFLVVAIVRREPEIGASLHDLSKRTVLFETLTLCGGALVLAHLAPNETGSLSPCNIVADKLASFGRYLFSISMLTFGIAHFQIPAFIATLIPA